MGDRAGRGIGRRSTAAGLLLAAGLIVLLPAAAGAQKLVIVVRHAERADGGAGAASMTGTPADPPLSAAGEARAERLAAMLADAGIAAIYTSEFRRTKDTAAPLARRLGLAAREMPARDSAALAARLKAEHAADVVLVIGHSNTAPEVIRALGGPAVTIADDDYTSLFVLAPVTGALVRIRF